MITLILSLLTGIICGTSFGLLRLPIPAPPNLGGILGIIGIFLGFLLAQKLRP